MTEQNPVKVGITGLGRSGWNIHANAIHELPNLFRVVGVCDPAPERQKDAKDRFGCTTYAEYDALVKQTNIELMIVATPSNLHNKDVIAALRCDKDVMVEKPMASDLAGVDEMISVANTTGRMLTVNQNRRWQPDFLKVRKIIASGVLGRTIEVRIRSDRFGRRWDWQTLKQYGGGELNNSGAHYIDMGLLLFDDPRPKVFCHMESTSFYAGDAENHVRVLLTPEAGPLVDVAITTHQSYQEPSWVVIGTRGSLVCMGKEIRWKFLSDDTVPPMPLDTKPTHGRKYNQEQLPMTEEIVDLSDDFNRFSQGHGVLDLYRSLYKTLRHAEPLAITPESVRRQAAVLEECRKICPV